MNAKELLAHDSAWMKEEGLSIVLSTRVRLARNLSHTAFPHALSMAEAQRVEETIAQKLVELPLAEEKIMYLPLPELSRVDKKVLTEKHLISPVFAEMGQARGVGLSQNHRISVMVNEEDHLRIQVLLPGGRLREAIHLANQVDDALEDRLDIAYLEKFGYLTSCPTNVGTGLRISVMAHLPALVRTNRYPQVLGSLTPLGLAVRGLYGEGSRAFGNIFQISNQVTLGKTEEDTLTHLEAVIKQIVDRELDARATLEREAPLIIQDKVWRARGILENARLLSAEETFSLLTEDRLGIEMGILPSISSGFAWQVVNTLQGSLQAQCQRPLDSTQLNFERAKAIRKMYERKDV